MTSTQIAQPVDPARLRVTKVVGHGCTHVGGRANNEDSFLVAPQLGVFAVADGMGGYDGGEVASALALATLEQELRESELAIPVDLEATWPTGANLHQHGEEVRLAAAIVAANERVCAARFGNLGEMGTTIAVLVVTGADAVIAHVGDSRVYRFRDGVLKQLTRDHSLNSEYRRVQPGMELPFNLRNVITRALGRKDARPELQRIDVRAGDRFVLCTDGLNEKLDDAQIAAVIAGHGKTQTAPALVARAVEVGTSDNTTVVVVECVPEESVDQPVLA